MGPIAEGFGLGMAAAAECEDLAGQVELMPVDIDYLERALDAIGTVGPDRDLGFGH